MEHTIRALTADEAASVLARLEQWRAGRARHEPHPAFVLSFALALCIGASLFGAWRGNIPMLVIAGIVALLLVALIVAASRKRQQRLAAACGPWHAPDGGWKVRETHIVARSIVGAASGDEDYVHRLLFEVPGGEWFFSDAYDLEEAGPGVDLAREIVHLTRLWPNGRHLSVESSGEAIPRHGSMSPCDTGEEYAAAVERGWIWRPFDEDGEPPATYAVATPAQIASLEAQLVHESALPAWILEAVKRT